MAGSAAMEAQTLRPLNPGFCDWCDEKIVPKRTMFRKPTTRFCCTRCRVEYWKTAARLGATVVPHLIRWRKFRGRKGTPGEGALGDIQFIVDAWISEGRMKAPAQVEAQEEAA